MFETAFDFLKDLWGFLNERKKILACPTDHYSSASRCFDCLHSGFCACAVYLHPILKKTEISFEVKKNTKIEEEVSSGLN